MKAPAIMQAMPSSCLLMLTVISFPPGLRLIGLTAFETILPQGVPARLWRRGDGTGGALVFFLLADGAFSPPVFDRRVPPRFAGWVRSLEWDYLSLNRLENPRWITQSRFKAVSHCGGVSSLCCGCHEGVYGRAWGLSEAFQRGRGAVPAQRCWGGWVVDGANTL